MPPWSVLYVLYIKHDQKILKFEKITTSVFIYLTIVVIAILVLSRFSVSDTSLTNYGFTALRKMATLVLFLFMHFTSHDSALHRWSSIYVMGIIGHLLADTRIRTCISPTLRSGASTLVLLAVLPPLPIILLFGDSLLLVRLGARGGACPCDDFHWFALMID